MLTNKEMVDKGYSKVFRCCFDLLAKYADGDGAETMWRQCAEDATRVYDQFSDRTFAPMVSEMLHAVFNEIERLHTPGTECMKQSGKGGKYRFTL